MGMTLLFFIAVLISVYFAVLVIMHSTEAIVHRKATSLTLHLFILAVSSATVATLLYMR